MADTPLISDDSCCVIDQSHNKCVKLDYDDSRCAKLYECCGGIHDAGLQAKCMSRVRECRKLGNAWDPIRRLKPMDAHAMYVDTPGYTTQGVLENFGSFQGLTLKCVLKSAVCGLLMAMLIKHLFKTKISTERIVGVSVLAAVVQCMLKTM
jgi:hypothetical protein